MPLPINKDKTDLINKKLWFIINSELSEFDSINNEDYFLEENDIIKFGFKKYIISKINRLNIENKPKMDVFNLIPECKGIKKCEGCGKLMVRLCRCEEYNHFDEIRDWIKERASEFYKGNIRSYNFIIHHCDEIIERDKRCQETHINNCCCKKCNIYYPLKFKVKKETLESLNIELPDDIIEHEEKIDENYKVLNFYKIDKPEDKDYMIMESLEDFDSDNNNNVVKKIHVIELKDGEKIKIGRKSDNDVIDTNASVSGSHAFIKYDKTTGKILIKNLSKHAGTLAFINDTRKKIFLSEKPLFIQGSQSFIKLQIMKEDDFLAYQDKFSYVYPPIYEDEKK